MKEIRITEIENIKIGNAENAAAGTGCTVIIGEKGMAAGLDVRGGGPAARESELLKPMAAAQVIHAVVLGGGSAFGLDAAGGVMTYLEEQGIGLDVGVTKVPLVCQSDIFDLGIGDARVRPDPAMGYAACENAERGNYRDGNFGGGCGASVGKLYGKEFCMKSGIGSFAVQIGELKVGAIVIVNAMGDIYDWRTGEKIAGLLAEDKKSFRQSDQELYQSYEVIENRFTARAVNAAKRGETGEPGKPQGAAAERAEMNGEPQTASAPGNPASAVTNTTIGAVITNGKFDKSRLCKIAGMAHDGYARSIRPVHTSTDGDSIYALSVGGIAADQDMVGTLAAEVMSEAILRAVKAAEPAYGCLAWKSLAK